MKKLILTLLVCTTLATAEQKAFMGLSLNIPRLAEFMSSSAPPEEQEDPQFKMMLGTLRMLGEGHADLLHYSDPEHGALPVLTMPGGQEALTKAIEEGPLNPFFVKVADGYKINPELNPPQEGEAEEAAGIAMDDLVLRFHEGSAILAPEPMHVRHAAQDILPLSSSLAGQQGIIKVDQNLVTLAIDFPEQLGDDLADQIAANELGEALPPAEMVTQMGSALIDMLFEPLKKIQGFRLGFKFDGEDGRKLSYLQTFRDAAEGQKVFDALQAKTLEPGEEVLAGLLETVNGEGFTTRTGYKGQHLIMQTSWDKAQDEVIGENVMGVVMGMMMGAAIAGDVEPSEGNIVTEYETSPTVYAAQTDLTSLKSGLGDAVVAQAFADNYWDRGNEPHMSVEIDPLNFPNIALYEVTYEVKAVTDTNGVDILRIAKNDFNRLNFQFGHSQRLRIPIQKDIEEGRLHKAEVELAVKGPAAIHMVELDTIGQTAESGTLKATLDQMEKDVVSVSYKGADKVKLIGFDATGKQLRWNEGMGSGGSKYMRFRGIPTKVKVVAQQGEETFKVSAAIDLNGGKSAKPPEEASTEVRTRYQSAPIRQHANLSDAEIEALEVSWVPAKEEYDENKIAIVMPRPATLFEHKWESFYFGESEALPISASPHVNSKGQPQITFHTRGDQEDDGIRAAFGKVKLNISRGVEQLTFDKQLDASPIKQTAGDGTEYEVIIDKNHVTMKTKSDKILYTTARDKDGRPLKRSNQRSKSGATIYWGQVQQVIAEVRTGVTERLLDFDLEVGEHDAAAYAAFKKQIDRKREVYQTLQMLIKAGERVRYADHLAGLYYIHDKDKDGKALALIPEKIAHSDPGGAATFNYEVKPYLGYHFSFAKGSMDESGVGQDRLKNARERDFAWDGGPIKGHFRSGRLNLMATPVDPKEPSFFTYWSNVHHRVLEAGQSLEYLPASSDRKDWPGLTFIGE